MKPSGVKMARLWLWGAVVGCGGPSLPEGPVTLSVPGALRLSVHCGGADTVHQAGDAVEFVPQGATCEILAPMSPVMPLRGRLRLTGASSYVCHRSNTDLHCGPVP